MTDDDKAPTSVGAQREPAHDKKFVSSWLGTVIAGVVAAALVCACAGQRPLQEAKALFDAGQADAGLARLEEAVKSDPANIEFRIALASRRAATVSRLIGVGESARRDRRLADAEKAYAQALALDPNQLMASQGMEAIKAERRNRQMLVDAEALFKQGGAAPWAEAQDKLRRVLAENPAQKEALNLKTQINEAQAKLQKPEARLAAIYRKPITLEFRDAPLKAVFDVIAKVSGLNFFFDKDLRPDLKATILAKNTSIEDAVRLLLVTNQLEQKILNENSVLIYPNTPQKLKDYQTLTLRTFYLTNADVKAVSNTIKTIVKTKDLVIDERLGLIIMRDTPEAIRVAERIVALQDLSDPEVMLDVEILEIKRSRLLDLGVDWPASLNLTPLQSTGSNLTLAALRQISPATTQATIAGSLGITANQQDQDTNTLANPRIRVRNKEKAKILIGDRVPIITTTSTSTGFVSESVNYVDVGLKLEVEPHIYLDEEVGIKINLEVSTLGAQTTSKSGTLTYQIGSRGANTVLRLKDGETQILAGLINDQERASANKVPGLGDLFVIGRLFGSHNDDKQRSEILLSITPHVLRSIRRPDLMAAEFESGTEANIGAETLRMSTVDIPAAAADGKAVGTVGAAGAASASSSANAPNTPNAPIAPIAPKVAAADAARSANILPGPLGAAAAAMPITAPAGGPVFTWLAPTQIKVGEQFSAVLKLSSQNALRGMPLLVGFDPLVLQVAGIVEGDFFKQGNGRSQFSQRVDLAQGKIFVAAVRQGSTGADSGVNGNASVVTLTFKALKAMGLTRIQLLSATPEPPPSAPLAMPVEALLRITP